MKFAVIKTGGKQYLVYENDEIFVDRLHTDKDASLEFETLATGDDEKNEINLGTPLLSPSVKGTVIDHLKGDKVRTARFKAKSRYRKLKGSRAHLTKVKIAAL